MSPVRLEVDPRQAEALRSAADYLSGFARACGLLDEARYPLSDVREVVRTLRDLHVRAAESARAA